jgi:hypothetical protein
MNTIVRNLSLLAVLLILVPSMAAAAVDDEINRMEESRYAALIGKDWTALHATLADDFFYNTAGGAQLSRSEFIGLMQSGAVVVRKVVRSLEGLVSEGTRQLIKTRNQLQDTPTKKQIGFYFSEMGAIGAGEESVDTDTKRNLLPVLEQLKTVFGIH